MFSTCKRSIEVNFEMRRRPRCRNELKANKKLGGCVSVMLTCWRTIQRNDGKSAIQLKWKICYCARASHISIIILIQIHFNFYFIIYRVTVRHCWLRANRAIDSPTTYGTRCRRYGATQLFTHMRLIYSSFHVCFFRYYLFALWERFRWRERELIADAFF